MSILKHGRDRHTARIISSSSESAEKRRSRLRRRYRYRWFLTFIGVFAIGILFMLAVVYAPPYIDDGVYKIRMVVEEETAEQVKDVTIEVASEVDNLELTPKQREYLRKKYGPALTKMGITREMIRQAREESEDG